MLESSQISTGFRQADINREETGPELTIATC